MPIVSSEDKSRVPIVNGVSEDVMKKVDNSVIVLRQWGVALTAAKLTLLLLEVDLPRPQPELPHMLSKPPPSLDRQQTPPRVLKQHSPTRERLDVHGPVQMHARCGVEGPADAEDRDSALVRGVKEDVPEDQMEDVVREGGEGARRMRGSHGRG